MKSNRKLLQHQSGFSLTELLVVVVIIAIISAFSIMGINKARSSMSLTNSARVITTYLEKARIDSIRRRAKTTAQMAKVEVLTSTTYKVTMDFDGRGNITSRTFPVENGVSIIIPNDPDIVLPSPPVPLPPTAVFDWRGNSPGGESFVLSNGTSQTTVNVTDSGDVTLNSSISIPVPAITTVNSTAGISSDTVLNASSSGCTISANTSSLTLRKNRNGTVRISHSSATGTNTVTAAPTSTTITITPETRTITGNGNGDFSINSGRKTGYFAVTFSSTCGSRTVSLTVTN
jgi:prepilin-type N-terminal cleavage/methylation domain-containing protein